MPLAARLERNWRIWSSPRWKNLTDPKPKIMKTKQQLLYFCHAFVEGRISRIQKSITGVQESLTSETKSSAGDKHETGRAMLQLEREKLGKQLEEVDKMKQSLARVDIKNPSEKIRLGSLVHTSKADYFLAISAGECKLGVKKVFCISSETPIGKLLLGKLVKDTFIFNGEEIQVLGIT